MSSTIKARATNLASSYYVYQEKRLCSQAWWHMPFIPVLRRQWQGNSVSSRPPLSTKQGHRETLSQETKTQRLKRERQKEQIVFSEKNICTCITISIFHMETTN